MQRNVNLFSALIAGLFVLGLSGRVLADTTTKTTTKEETTTSAAECSKHEGHDHKHGKKCGHKSVKHENHTDYMHDGHQHATHGDHVDEHKTR